MSSGESRVSSWPLYRSVQLRACAYPRRSDDGHEYAGRGAFRRATSGQGSITRLNGLSAEWASLEATNVCLLRRAIYHAFLRSSVKPRQIAKRK